MIYLIIANHILKQYGIEETGFQCFEGDNMGEVEQDEALPCQDETTRKEQHEKKVSGRGS